MIIKAIMKNYVIFNTVAGISIMGIILDENQDSFIVGLPARLVKHNGVLKADPYVPTETSRFFKSTLLNCIELVDEFELPYILYVIENSVRIEMPEEDLDILKARVEEILSESREEVLEIPGHISYIFPQQENIH